MWYSSQSVSGLAPILQVATSQEATLKRATRKARFSRYHCVVSTSQPRAWQNRRCVGGIVVAGRYVVGTR